MMVMTMRVAGNEGGEGVKAMAMATRVVGEQTVMVAKRAIADMTRSGGAGGSDDPPLRTT
jgi:hypothetical protein